MNQAAQKTIKQALNLELTERAEVAAELLASLDGEADAEVERAWAQKIEHRIERIQSGVAKGRPWSEVRASLRASE